MNLILQYIVQYSIRVLRSRRHNRRYSFQNTSQLCAAVVAVDCSNGLGNMAYYGGLSAFKPAELATQSMVCIAGYRWSDGSAGTTVKTAVCTDVSGQYGFGIGQWISTDGTTCVGTYEQY